MTYNAGIEIEFGENDGNRLEIGYTSNHPIAGYLRLCHSNRHGFTRVDVSPEYLAQLIHYLDGQQKNAQRRS